MKMFASIAFVCIVALMAVTVGSMVFGLWWISELLSAVFNGAQIK